MSSFAKANAHAKALYLPVHCTSLRLNTPQNTPLHITASNTIVSSSLSHDKLERHPLDDEAATAAGGEEDPHHVPGESQPDEVGVPRDPHDERAASSQRSERESARRIRLHLV